MSEGRDGRLRLALRGGAGRRSSRGSARSTLAVCGKVQTSSVYAIIRMMVKDFARLTSPKGRPGAGTCASSGKTLMRVPVFLAR